MNQDLRCCANCKSYWQVMIDTQQDFNATGPEKLVVHPILRCSCSAHPQIEGFLSMSVCPEWQADRRTEKDRLKMQNIVSDGL